MLYEVITLRLVGPPCVEMFTLAARDDGSGDFAGVIGDLDEGAGATLAWIAQADTVQFVRIARARFAPGQLAKIV